MYPEEVYYCGLPLPYELFRPIAFNLARVLIKDKLRFPWCHDHGGGQYIGTRYGTRGYILECKGGRYLHWMSIVMPGGKVSAPGAILNPISNESIEDVRRICSI